MKIWLAILFTSFRQVPGILLCTVSTIDDTPAHPPTHLLHPPLQARAANPSPQIRCTGSSHSWTNLFADDGAWLVDTTGLKDITWSATENPTQVHLVQRWTRQDRCPASRAVAVSRSVVFEGLERHRQPDPKRWWALALRGAPGVV